VSVAVVIPTRNRPDLAVRAVRSLLDQDCALDIYVSDNSEPARRLTPDPGAGPRVTWLRPPREMSMPEHWEWALGEATERSQATHFSIHYDRKISKPNHWGQLAALAERSPETLISYPTDHVADHPPPLRLWQTPWTGKLFAVRTTRTAELLAAGHVTDIAHALPILSNCLVPRAVLTAIAGRFGSVCNSTAADAAFLSRFLTVAERQLHHDRPPSIAYAPHRSAGLGYLRGGGGDFRDYLDRFEGKSWLHAAPVPGVNLGQNMLYHEYELVRRETGALPPLDRAAVLADLGFHLRWIDDPTLRAELAGILRDHGWTGPEPGPLPVTPWRAKLSVKLQQARMRWLGHVPSMITGFSFPDDEAALRDGVRYPRAPQATHEHLALLEPEEVAL
jgi:hypothetical protein